MSSLASSTKSAKCSPASAASSDAFSLTTPMVSFVSETNSVAFSFATSAANKLSFARRSSNAAKSDPVSLPKARLG